MTTSRIGYSILTLALAGLICPSGGQIALKNSSFSIRGIIFKQTYDQHQPTEIEVEESYSKEQSRARIDYRIKPSADLGKEWSDVSSNNRLRGSFVYDSSREAAILVDQACSQTKPDEIETTLGLYLPKDNDEIEDYIVGSARLLLFIDKHRNKLALISLRDTIYVRNMRSVVYFYDHLDESTGTNVRFEIYYSELSRAVDKDKSIPIKVAITTTDALIVVDFFEPELIAPNAPKHLRRFESFNEHSYVDQFGFNLATGCSTALKDKRENLFASTDNDPNGIKQFSFRARIKSYSMPEPVGLGKEVFVAYDQGVNSIRIDSLNSGLSSVFNIKLNRAYHLRANSHDLKQTNLIGSPDGSFDSVAVHRSECIITGVHRTAADYDESKFRLSKLLFGSQEFVYMGRGQVHNIDAVIYEAANVALPFWLDREIYYFDTNDRLCSREPLKSLSGILDNKIVDLVAYFDEKDDEHRLLMIDINYFDQERSKMFGKQTVYIDDFVWKLDNQSPTGVRVSELFSMADDCSSGASNGLNSYGQVNLLLESLDQIDDADSLLDVVSLRHMALLASLQNKYRLPVSMIYDLETKVQKYRDHLRLDGGETIQIHASFWLAKHPVNLVSLKFVGFGSRKSSIITAEDIIQVQSFAECFIEAARREGAVNFGFRSSDNVCLIDKAVLKVVPEVNNGDIKEQSSRLLKAKPDTVELYQVIRRFDRALVSESGDDRPELMKEMETLEFFGIDKVRETVQFVIKEVHLDRAKQQSPFTNEKSNQDGLEKEIESFKRAGLIDGVGIIRDETSKRIGFGDDKVTEDRCHAACLLDSNCRLYSVCSINLETTCTTSGLNITDYLRDIVALVMKRDTKLEAKVTIQPASGQQQLELTKHPNCRIKMKNYINLFARPVSRLQQISRRRVYAVDSVNKCAEMATMRNIRTLQEGAKQLTDALALLSAKSADQKAVDLVNSHQTTMKSLLGGFFYFDKTVYQSIGKDSQVFRDFITKQFKQLDNISSLDSIEGFCLMDGELSLEEKAEIDSLEDFKVLLINMFISYDFYQYKFENFYEKHHGVILLADNMSAAEHEAFIKYSTGRDEDLSESDSSIMRSFLDRGGNIQEADMADVERCAEICLRQKKGPWPGCRSFDIVTYRSGSPKESVYVTCLLNSITLKQAFANQRYDLVHDYNKDEDDESLIIHYEPRSGFVEDELEISYDIGLAASWWHHIEGSKVRRLGIFCVILLSLFGGISLGMLAATKYIEREQKRQEEKLVPQGSGRMIEFDNQVNSDGQVKVP